MSRSRKAPEKGALELIEESMALLRGAPAATLAAYYIGALPFVLALLYFLADMSRGAFAWQHGPESAMGVTLLYIWMKSWQTVFAVRLHGQLCGINDDVWPVSRISRLVATQALLQSTSLFVLPFVSVVMVPFGWVYAFYHNVTLFGDGRESGLRSVTSRSWRQACVWPAQNHVALTFLWSFGLIVFLNVAVGLFCLPTLLKMLLGIQSAFTMSMATLFNSTFLAVAAGITYLCVNPLIKALYIVRCFYGESRQTGADLKAGLRTLATAAAFVILLSLLALPARTFAADPPPENPPLASQLDKSIDHVINQPEFTWRQPRQEGPSLEEKGFFERLMESLQNTLHRWGESMGNLIEKLMRLLLRLFRPRSIKVDETTNWFTGLHMLYLLVIAVAVTFLLILAGRIWRQRGRRRVDAVAEPAAAVVDVADENILASQLSPEGWLKTAGDLMAAGDLRLALRAHYLATLSHLGEKELIRIAKSKSNLEYERELQRRAREQQHLLQAFSENLLTFENIWYGMHEVTQDSLDRFKANFELIRGSHAN